eukprot:scaffold159327_cov42-Tisochrysis_lutea.AAC.1
MPGSHSQIAHTTCPNIPDHLPSFDLTHRELSSFPPVSGLDVQSYYLAAECNKILGPVIPRHMRRFSRL